MVLMDNAKLIVSLFTVPLDQVLFFIELCCKLAHLLLFPSLICQ